MTRLADTLEDAVGVVAPAFDFHDVLNRARTRRRARIARAAIATGLTVAVAVVSLGVIAGRHDANRPRVAVHPPAPAAADDVLVIDDGYDGVATLDLAQRVAARLPVLGQAAGDQPFRSMLVGQTLVVGWDDVYAAPLDGSPSRKLGTGVAVPAVELGAVWLTSYGQVRTPTERLVDMHGRVLLEGRGPTQGAVTYAAAASIPGGLVFEFADGLALWDARAEKITRHLGGRGSLPGPATSTTFAWCVDCRTGIELTDLATGATRRVDNPPGTDYLFVDAARFSPDGSQLAVPIQQGGVALIDVATARVTAVLPQGRAVGWSPDGRRLYVASETHITERDNQTGATRELTNGVGAAGNFVVVSRDAIAGMLRGVAIGSSASCRPPNVQPSGRTGGCAFRY